MVGSRVVEVVGSGVVEVVGSGVVEVVGSGVVEVVGSGVVEVLGSGVVEVVGSGVVEVVGVKQNEAPACEYLPGTQLMQTEAPACEYVLGAQSIQTSGPGCNKYNALPDSVGVEYLPSSHLMQAGSATAIQRASKPGYIKPESEVNCTLRKPVVDV